jgi:hypothetical protein
MQEYFVYIMLVQFGAEYSFEGSFGGSNLFILRRTECGDNVATDVNWCDS